MSKTDKKPLSMWAGVTTLGLLAVWATAAMILVITGQGLRAWIAWAIALVVIALATAAVDAYTPRKPRADAHPHRPDKLQAAINRTNEMEI
ncbi:MAG: hypothetical protein ACK5LO_02425 [Leucobacter sp.]